MRLINISFLSTLLIILSSCHKGEYGMLQENKNIIGKWAWLSTDGGFGNHIHETPKSSGQEINLELTKNYKYIIYTKDNIISKGVYNLSMEKSIYNHKMSLFLNLEYNSSNPKIITKGIITNLKDSSLEISDNFYDGLGSTFQKIIKK